MEEPERGQVVRAGVQVGGRNIRPRVLHVAPACPKVSDGPHSNQVRARSRGLRHAQGNKDGIVQEITIRLAGNLRQDAAQSRVPEIGIHELLSRRPGQDSVPPKHQSQRRRLPRLIVIVSLAILRQPSHVLNRSPHGGAGRTRYSPDELTGSGLHLQDDFLFGVRR
jgi:hypothetical protein